jgi:hypothetical protein
MLKNTTKLECKINGKDHFYMADQETSTAEAKEALFQFLKYVGQIEDNAKATQEAQVKSEEVPVKKTQE